MASTDEAQAEKNPEIRPRYVVAVSGGVDSVVLLDALHRQHTQDIVVAHVDHGIRPESSEDAVFVRELAGKYDVPFETVRLELGVNASEEVARRARYAFLRDMKRKHHGHIVTAHHADDVVETVAINLLRGTGWRGLAVFGADDVYRPLTVMFKHEIIAQARHRGLEWREDSTNESDAYLRNRIRKQTKDLPMDIKLEILALWRRQHELKQDITRETAEHSTFRRHPYIMMVPEVALEVLAHTLDLPLTRPQLKRALLAIKAARAGSEHHLAGRHSLVFGVDDFRLVVRKK